MPYKRVLLKVSGESLAGSSTYGIDPERLKQFAGEIKEVSDAGAEIAVVIGGGNIYRGIESSTANIERAQGDYMGMMATIINGMALQGALEQLGVKTRLLSAIRLEQICEPFIRRRAIRHLEKHRVVIFAGGTGNPFFTTDTAAALRAVEIGAEVLLKGTRVKGIFTADPEKDRDAEFFDRISYTQVFNKNLHVMDMTAITMCYENKLPIIVFNMNEKGNLMDIINGKTVGTLVTL